MRLFANLFLIIFLVDGAVSFLDEIVSLALSLPALTHLRQVLGEFVLLMAFAVYQSLGIDNRLPKRLFLPLIIFVLLIPISVWVFPAVSGNWVFGLLAAVGQLLLCLLPVHYLRKSNQTGYLMRREMFQEPFFSLRNTLVFGAVNLVVIPLVSVLLLFATVSSYMQKSTSGFMRLAPKGIYMTEKVYRRDNRAIRLVGMIHMGEKQYYDELVGLGAPGRTLVLAEGVSDDKSLLPNRLDYGKVADYLGLTLQQEKMHFKGRLIDAAELEKPGEQARTFGAGSPAQVDILRADVDVSSFRPPTIRFLDELGKQMKATPSVAKGFVASSAWSGKYITPEMQKVIVEDILYRRNYEVIRHLKKAVDRYDTIVVPWGALHMPGIEVEVLHQGFVLQQARERMSIDFWKIFKERS